MYTLLEQERIARLEKDDNKMLEIMTQIKDSCKDDTELLTYIKILSKRKAQLKEPLKKIIQSVYIKKIEKLNNESINFILQLLKEIIEGKFYLEAERVHITQVLKEYYEQNNEDNKALESIFTVPVETFSVEEKIKISYQLEVLRLSIKLKDWSKSDLVSRRIRMSYFKEENDNHNEISYYNLMIALSLGQHKFFEASGYFKSLYHIDKMNSSSKITLCSFFAILSTEKEKEKEKMLLWCLENKDNTDKMRKIIKQFIGNDVLSTTYVEYAKEIDQIYAQDFLRAINEHNFKAVSKYFGSLRLDDLKDLLQCSIDDCVNLIQDCVSRDFLSVKIDQTGGIVVFEDRSMENEEEAISKVLDRLVRVNHLIRKENVKASE